MKLIVASGITDIGDYKYNKYVDNVNRLINLQIEESFAYFYDHLEDWRCLGEEEYLKIVFEDFFVDRLGVEECKKKIRAVYDYISSPAYFNYIEPVYDYILYKVIYNMIEDFEKYDEELVTEWFIKIENDCEHVNNRYAQMIHLYKAIEDFYNESIRLIKDQELEKEIEVIHYLASLGISDMDVLFEDSDFEPDFLDYVVNRYIQTGGNSEGIDSLFGMDLNKYTNCMHTVTLDLFNKCQAGNKKNDIEEGLREDIYKALVFIQRNADKKNENAITDILRDHLGMIYEVKDQSRIGISMNGKDAGEVDLSIWKKGFPIALIESIKLVSVSKKNLISHIGKLMNNYNPFGCEELYLLVYYVGKSFNSFWDMMIEEIIDYVGKKYEKVDATKDIMNPKYINSEAASIKISIENKTVYLYVMGIKT